MEVTINAAAAVRSKKPLTKIRPAIKYKELYVELMKVFTQARASGKHVDFNWIYSKARKINREQTGDPNASLKQHVIVNFIKRHHLKRRKIQRNKRRSIIAKKSRSGMQRCAKELLEQALLKLITTPSGDDSLQQCA